MPERLRRLRRTSALRELFREVRLSANDFVYPIFVKEGIAETEAIASMPGQFRHSLKSLKPLAAQIVQSGVRAVLLFGVPDRKDNHASAATDDQGIVQKAIRALKAEAPELVVMTDVCMCAYTPHGHCGILKGAEVDNDETLPVLGEMARSHAAAGADVVAPSAMMDGQVGALRCALDTTGHEHVAVMAYSAKFASAFYGPFREAAGSSPSFGDRASYQHDFANPRHARRELLEDASEGADILMIKPGLAYLDLIARARDWTDLPIAAYAVSGEYSMIKAAAERGWLDERSVVLETLTAFKRAGADLIITYYALEAAQWISNPN